MGICRHWCHCASVAVAPWGGGVGTHCCQSNRAQSTTITMMPWFQVQARTMATTTFSSLCWLWSSLQRCTKVEPARAGIRWGWCHWASVAIMLRGGGVGTHRHQSCGAKLMTRTIMPWLPAVQYLAILLQHTSLWGGTTVGLSAEFLIVLTYSLSPLIFVSELRELLQSVWRTQSCMILYWFPLAQETLEIFPKQNSKYLSKKQLVSQNISSKSPKTFFYRIESTHKIIPNQ